MANTMTHMSSAISLVTVEHYMLVLETSWPVWTLLSFLGAVSNVINIKTFIVIGLKDNMIVSFLLLSVIDLAYSCITFVFAVSTFAFTMEYTTSVRYVIDPYGFAVYLFNIMILINISNMLVTTFIAVARCMCVARPLHFKNTFTIMRALVIIFVSAAFAIVSYTPVLANMNMLFKFDQRINASRITLWISPERKSAKVIVWIIVNMVLPLATQVIVVVCIIVMKNCLRATVMFRQTSTAIVISSKNSHESDSPNDSSKATDKLNGRDLRALQQVLIISLVYIACNTPKIIISIITAAVPDFGIGGMYHFTYLSVNSIGKHFEIFNSAVNFVIYYKYNTKFRAFVCVCWCNTKQMNLKK